MKKLIYSQEDVDLMISIETQQYQEELEYEHYCNEQLRNKIINLENKIKRLKEDNKYKEVLDKIKKLELYEFDLDYDYGENPVEHYTPFFMREYIEKLLEEIE